MAQAISLDRLYVRNRLLGGKALFKIFIANNSPLRQHSSLGPWVTRVVGC